MKKAIELDKILRLNKTRSKQSRSFDDALRGLGVAIQKNASTKRRA